MVVVRLVYLNVLILCWGVYLRWGNGGSEGQMLGIISSGLYAQHIYQLLFAMYVYRVGGAMGFPSHKPEVPSPPPSQLEHNPSYSSCSNAI